MEAVQLGETLRSLENVSVAVRAAGERVLLPRESDGPEIPIADTRRSQPFLDPGGAAEAQRDQLIL